MSMTSKSSRQMAVPELNMALHRSFIDCAKCVDENYDKDLVDYFLPYHQFVDKLVRYGLSLEKVNENVIRLSCLIAIEGLPLHFVLFCKLWWEIYNKSHEIPKYKSCMKELCQQKEFVEYVDLILFEERTIINVNPMYSFLCSVFPRISSKVVNNQWNSLVNTLVTSVIADQTQADTMKDSELDELARRLTADLRVLSLLFSASPPQKSDVSEMLLPSLKKLLTVCRKHQKTKRDALKEQQEKEAGKKEDKTEGKDEETSDEEDDKEADDNDDDDDDSARAPPNKRRRGEDGETVASESAESTSACQSAEKDADETEKEESTSGEFSKLGPRKGNGGCAKAQTSRELIPKSHPAGWIDTLAKVVESTISKLPK